MRLIGLAAAPLAYACALGFNGIGSSMVMLVATTAVALLWTAVLLWPDLRSSRLVLPGTWVFPAMLGFLLWLLVSSTWSTYSYVSFQYAWVVGATPLWCLLWLKAPKSLFSWETVWRSLLAIQTIMLIWGIYEYLAFGRRASGPLIDSNAYGALVNVFFFPMLFRLMALQQQKAPAAVLWGYRLLLATSLFALFASYSRGAQLAWITLMIPAIGLVLIARQHKKAAIGILALLLCSGAIGAFITLQYRDATALDRPSLFDPQQPAFQVRLHLNRSTWEIYKDHPWLGTGLGTFKHYYPAYRNPQETTSAGFHAHNDYLEFLQEGGPLLLLFLLLCLLAAALPAWSSLMGMLRRRGEPPPPRSLEIVGLALGVGTLFIQAGINFIFFVLPHSIVAGLFIAQLHRERVGADKVVRIPLPGSILLGILVIALALPLWNLSVSTASAMVLGRQSDLTLVRHVRDDPLRRYRFIESMTTLQPGDAAPHMLLAAMYHARSLAVDDDSNGKSLAFARRARAHYLYSLKALPVSSDSCLGLARLLRAFPELRMGMPEEISSDPEVLLEMAIRYAPAKPAAYFELADLYDARGETRRAYDVLTRAQTWLEIPGVPRRNRILLLEQALEMAQRLELSEDILRVATALQKLDSDNAAATAALEAATAPDRRTPKSADAPPDGPASDAGR